MLWVYAYLVWMFYWLLHCNYCINTEKDAVDAKRIPRAIVVSAMLCNITAVVLFLAWRS